MPALGLYLPVLPEHESKINRHPFKVHVKNIIKDISES